MSQMGMQMPGRQRRRKSMPGVYAGMMLAAVASLTMAIVFVALAGMRIGPGEGVMAAINVHPEGRVELSDR